MRPSRISSLFTGSFLITAYFLQWWQQMSYPFWIWITLVIITLTGLAPCATGGEGASGGALAHGELFFASFFCLADKRKKMLLATCIVSICLGIGAAFLSVSHATKSFASQTIPSHASTSITLIGTVTGDAQGSLPSALYPMRVEAIDQSGTQIPVVGSVLVEDFGGWPVYGIGDRIEATGTLELPKNSKDFRYDRYLRLRDISGILKRAKIASLPQKQETIPLRLRAILQSIRIWFELKIHRLFPEPEASLITGLLTGNRRGFSVRTLDTFAATGLTHLIAISGTNITIIVSLLGTLLFWIPLQWRLAPQCIGIILFALFTGAEASVVRAAIMGILGLMALELHRIADTRLAILWTATLMTAWKPEQLWWDAGFQLSFAAVIGVTQIAPIFKEHWTWIPETLALRESLAATVAAQITTLPITILVFRRVSLIAPLSNLLVAPVVPFAMLFGFLGTILSLLIFPLGQLIGWLGYGCAQWILFVATLLARMPYASVTISW